MTTPSSVTQRRHFVTGWSQFAKGWLITDAGNWWYNGTITGKVAWVGDKPDLAGMTEALRAEFARAPVDPGLSVAGLAFLACTLLRIGGNGDRHRR